MTGIVTSFPWVAVDSPDWRTLSPIQIAQPRTKPLVCVRSERRTKLWIVGPYCIYRWPTIFQQLAWLTSRLRRLWLSPGPRHYPRTRRPGALSSDQVSKSWHSVSPPERWLTQPRPQAAICGAIWNLSRLRRSRKEGGTVVVAECLRGQCSRNFLLKEGVDLPVPRAKLRYGRRWGGGGGDCWGGRGEGGGWRGVGHRNRLFCPVTRLRYLGTSANIPYSHSSF